MRRWLTILLLFVLPLQFSWAVAATYCQHEEVAAVSHFGHHAHEHQAEDAASGGSGKHLAKTGGLGVDNDCGFCHLNLAKPPFEPAAPLDVRVQLTADAPSPHAFRSRGPDHPERPNWCLA